MAGGVAAMRCFRDECGMTTTGMILSLLITLSLVFSAAQVYRINSASAQVQDVADAAALAAGNQVADFMLAARGCDAVVLSLSLTSAVSYGLGAVALCVPAAQGVGEKLIELGNKVGQARDDFSGRASDALNKVQRLLPYLAAARAASVASANDGTQEGARYIGVAVLVPFEGEEIADAAADDGGLASDVGAKSGELKEQASRADEAAKQASEAKQRGFDSDCGKNPSYCLYERASALATMPDYENPLYTSVDAWTFSVALNRAKAYYPKRLEAEAPADGSVAERARSELRKRFYAYAVKQMEGAYVNETDDSFEANFPSLPRNTEEMRQTSLYTDVAYPITEDGDERTMHAWSGCPEASDIVSAGSISQLESGEFVLCDSCEFRASSLGSVAAASTSIENGFEHHYLAIAQAAADYQKARNELDPITREAKTTAKSLFDKVKDAIGKAGSTRISPSPPGARGAIAIVANVGAASSSAGFENSFVASEGTLGTRVAVAGSTLLEEDSEEGKNAINSFLDGFKGSSSLVGAAGIVMDAWSHVLTAYADGEESLINGVEASLSAIPLVGASGLGSWAAGALKDAISTAGLEPANIQSLKPVLVNSGHVAASSDDSVAAGYLEVKKRVIENPLPSTDLFSSLLNGAEEYVAGEIAGTDSIEVARIDLVGNGEDIAIEIPLPKQAKDYSTSLVRNLFGRLRSIALSIRGLSVWE